MRLPGGRKNKANPVTPWEAERTGMRRAGRIDRETIRNYHSYP